MNAVSAIVLIVLLLAVCFCPRRWALVAVMAGVFFLTQGHSLSVIGLKLYPVRFLEAAAFGRVVLRRELVWTRLNRIDWSLLLLYNYAALVWILRSSQNAPQQFASAVDPALCYLALRALIGSLDDVRWFLSAFVGLLVLFTALVLLERLNGRSAFTLVGHIPELLFRNGRARSEGSFRHAILLGSVAASFLSLYIGLWLKDRRRVVAWMGAGACLTLVILTNSGGPVVSTAAVLLGWSLWFLRDRLYLVRRGVLALLLLLLVFMKAPIWYLPYKISGVIGGGGFHRGILMDQAWQNLDKWWLSGMEITQTADWLPYTHDLLGGADVTNQYLAFGIRAGLPAVTLIVTVLSLAFRAVGRALRAVSSAEEGRAEPLLIWGLGNALFAHVVSWWNVAYFDQSNIVWLMHLAAVSGAVSEAALRSHRVGTIPATPNFAEIKSKFRGAVPRGGDRSVIRRPNFVALQHHPTRLPSKR